MFTWETFLIFAGMSLEFAVCDLEHTTWRDKVQYDKFLCSPNHLETTVWDYRISFRFEIVTENHRLGCKCTARFVCKQRKLQRRKCVKSYKKGSRLIAALVLLPQSFTCFKPLGFQISVTLDRMGGDSLEYVVFQKSVLYLTVLHQESHLMDI